MSRRSILLIALLAAFSLGTYLVASRFTYRIGFPLDDAWIHQTYARNIAERGEWAFLPGQPSAGSTAPAWSLVLALGQLIEVNPLVWTNLLGWCMLAGIGIVGAFGMRYLLPEGRHWELWASLLLVFEWHLVWAAGSGMETLVFSLIILLGFLLVVFSENQKYERMDATRKNWMWLGLGALAGLSVSLRPDGITLLVAFAFAVLFSKRKHGAKLRIGVLLVIGFVVIFLPYLIFNSSLAGNWWPNTFFAKQAEYAILRETSFLKRYLNQARVPLVGVGVMLLPGFIWILVQSLLQRHAGILAGALWVIGYLGIYAWRLPVVYQHGRYVIPTLAVFCVWGLAGLFDILQSTRFSRLPNLLARAWLMASGLILLLFWILGARAFALDVAIIESEMVDTAKWVNQNTPDGALIAAHDIGALGYFGGRSIVDLAGLVSPEVIPFIRDEPAIGKFLEVQKADFLVTFPGWYPYLTSQATPVYSTSGGFSPQLGGENMTVFRLSN
jgi:hypothetical protein